jgi:aspartyl-tRNA(Asn)/glutamyl-tRNA(Gln) amidotransferase subunit B
MTQTDVTRTDVPTYVPVIGLETHVELATASKMFCGCPTNFNAEPNTNVCPTCLGLPGALPVPNEAAISMIMKIGLALGCSITEHSIFHRKNYFYADLPKNYQISQYDLPVCVEGSLALADGTSVHIERVHQEEDTGKSVHVGGDGRITSAEYSLLDFNRSGIPLVEIVTHPDIHSAGQARTYAQSLREVIVSLGVSDAKLEEGTIRFDANVSVRPQASTELGTKVEIKNMNSFRSLERAIEYEIKRQSALLADGGRVVQETRHWDEDAGVSRGGRVKEGSSDYRYFAEPDLVPLHIPADWTEQVRATLPELPEARRTRYVGLGLDDHLASVVVGAEPEFGALFEAAVAAGAPSVAAANWITGEITAALRREEMSLADTPLDGEMLSELVALVDAGTVSASAAKDVLAGVLAGEGRPETVAQTRDLIQISDSAALETAVDEVIAAHPDEFSRLRDGEQKLIGFFVGQVMRATGGKADPGAVSGILRGRAGL